MPSDAGYCAVAAHRRIAEVENGQRDRGRRRVALITLAVAVTCASSMVACSAGARGRRQVEMLSWINFHGDGTMGYSGLRTIMPSEVQYKGDQSATPLAIPGYRESVARYPMAYTGSMIRRARQLVISHHPAIRLQTTTSFSDRPASPGSTVQSIVPKWSYGAAAIPANNPGTYSASSMMFAPPAYMRPQFLGMVPSTSSKVGYSVGVSGAGYAPSAGFMPAAAYINVGKLERGFVPIRVAYPRPSAPALPSTIARAFVPQGPQMAYDPNNVNAGIYEGYNDINPSLGLPAIPRPVPVTVAITNTASEEVPHDTENATIVHTGADSTNATQPSEALTGARIKLPPGRAVRICDSEVVVIETERNSSEPSGDNASCLSLADVKASFGGSGYAALEEIMDAQAVLEEQKRAVVALPVGADLDA